MGHIVLPATAVARATDTRGRAGQGEVAEVATPREERGPLYIAVPDLTPQTPLFPAHLGSSLALLHPLNPAFVNDGAIA